MIPAHEAAHVQARQPILADGAFLQAQPLAGEAAAGLQAAAAEELSGVDAAHPSVPSLKSFQKSQECPGPGESGPGNAADARCD